MKPILFSILIFSFFNLHGQVAEFDKACEIIKSIHGGNIKQVVVREKVNGSDYFLYNYYFKIKPSDYISTVKDIAKDIVLFEKNSIKSDVFVNLKESKYYHRKGLGKLKSAILIEFVKFDGRFMRVDVEVGNFWKPKYKPSTSIYEYQFVFDQYGAVKYIDWLERKE